MTSGTAPVSIQFDLDRGERQLWAGVPKQGIVLRGSDTLLIAFSLIWCGFVVFWEISAIRDGDPVFILFGIPFVLVGAYLLVGRFWQEARRRARTTYAVTSERVIIQTGRSMQSLHLDSLTDVTLDEHGDGSGTISFGAGGMRAMTLAASGWPGAPHVDQFESIPDARHVHQIIRDARRALNDRSG